MNDWIDVNEKKAPFAVEVEVLTASGEIRKDMMQPVGSYSVYWGGVSFGKEEDPTHWRLII